MLRRLLFFGFGALISIIFLSMGSENRLKETLHAYIDYFSLDKRVIWHLKNDSTTFSIKAECQLVYYSLTKEDILSVLDDGKVNFEKSKTEKSPCQFYVIENTIKEMDLSVTFQFCDTANTVKVMRLSVKMEEEACNF